MAPQPTPSNLLTSYTYSPTLSSFTIPVPEYITLHPQIHHIVAGAVIFTSSTPTKVLIIKRATNDYAGNLWEIPGGSCDRSSGETILDGTIRELWEESGLKGTKVVRLVGEGNWIDRKKTWCKFSFEVEVEGVEGCEIKLDEEEHQDSLWVTEECRAGWKMREGKKVEILWTHQIQLETILEGFRLRKQVAV